MEITIHLPVTPAIKKYLEGRLGKEYKLSIDDWFGGTIINMLTIKRLSTSKEEKRPEKRTERFNIHTSLSMAEKNGFTIENKHEHMINKILNSLFRQDLYINAIINKKNYGIDYHTTINNILDVYDITEEEFNTDALKRDLIRKREEIESLLYLP